MAKERAAEKSAELKEPKVKTLSAEDKVIKTSKNQDKKEKKEKKSKKQAKIEEELASKPEVDQKIKPEKADAKQGPVSPSKEAEATPDYMSLDESEPEPVSQTPKRKASKKEARQKTSDSPKIADKKSKFKKTSDAPKYAEKEPESKEAKSKDKKTSEDKVEASNDGKKADKKDAKKVDKKTSAPSVAPSAAAVKSTKDLEKDESSSDTDSDSDSDSEDGGAKVGNTKGKDTNNTGPNRHARRRLMLIDRQKLKIQKREGVEEGSTEPNEKVDKALEEWTKNFDELNDRSVKKKAARAKRALKKRNDNHKRTPKGMTTKQLEKIHKKRNAKNEAKFAAPAA